MLESVPKTLEQKPEQRFLLFMFVSTDCKLEYRDMPTYFYLQDRGSYLMSGAVRTLNKCIFFACEV